MKNKLIRILSLVTAGVSLLCILPIIFALFETDYYVLGQNVSYSIFGFELYTDGKSWYMILIGCLGLISLLWNLIYGAYAAIDGRYRNLTWRIARYGYFYGAVMGLINFAVILSYAFYDYTLLAMWYIFLILNVAVIALEITLIILKDEDTKSKMRNIGTDN